MPTIQSHKQLRAAGRLPFCYACTKAFERDSQCDRDHVPPQSCFAKADRNVPLILRTHVECNHSHNANDELVGQLISFKLGRPPPDRGKRLNVEVMTSQAGALLARFDNLDFKGVIWRWVRAFHAALYRESVHIGSDFYVSPPVPSGQVINGIVRAEPLRQQHRLFVETIKINRAASNLDRIECNSEKLQYECVWMQGDDGGPWMCVFALNLYDWKELGDPTHFPPRGCVGCYALPNRLAPADATLATKLRVLIPNLDGLDPFGP